jgi:predicted PolB exonuclease-like 3'-5' exonuclease
VSQTDVAAGVPPTLVFDIETIPDAPGIREVFDLDPALSIHEVVEIARQRRRAAVGHDFLPLHLQRVVAISCVLREGINLHVWSVGSGDDERDLIQRFFDGLERFTPQLVSWNGGGFDLPVLHYRALTHGVVASRYWDLGDAEFSDSRDFRFNNYISRYHTRHIDLMDLLALYQPRNAVPLDQMARLMGLPGKLGMDGSQVWEAYQAGALQAIRDYCETDALNTWLVFLRFQLMRGIIDAAAHAQECTLVRDWLLRASQPHWAAFLARWRSRP